MKPKEVYNMRPVYSDYKYTNFRTNLRSLRHGVKRDLSRAESDEAAYMHDKNLIIESASKPWHRSDAYKLLKEDIGSGKAEGVKPQGLYNSRIEYKEFPLKKFRNQIYHEQDRIIKKKMIAQGTHPRFARLRHDPRKEKIKSTNVFPTKK